MAQTPRRPPRDSRPAPIERDRERAADLELDPLDELPVVARMVVEIRSDGRRMVARGALEDRASGQTVAIESRAGSALGLAGELARGIWGFTQRARRRLRALRRSIGPGGAGSGPDREPGRGPDLGKDEFGEGE